MKMGITVLVLMMVTAGLTFAAGDDEDDWDDWDDRFQGNFEKVTLTGTIDFTALGTILTMDGETWILLYPRQVLAYVELNEGDLVTVEGFKIPASPFRNTAENENYLKIISAEIDGTTYDLYNDWPGDFDGYPGDCPGYHGSGYYGPRKRPYGHYGRGRGPW